MHTNGRRLVTLTIFTPIVSARTAACLPVAPDSERIDLATPKFSHPTPITNPLHPTSRVEQVIFGGHVDNKPFRTEVTLLPETKPTPYRGTTIDTALIQ